MGLTKTPIEVLGQCLALVHKELDITERLLRENASVGIAPFIVAVIPQLLLAPLAASSTITIFLKTCFLATCYEYAFDIVNQTVPDGIAGDPINKPHRPIPSGMVTIRGAQIRWASSWLLFPLAAFILADINAAFWQIMWQATCWFCYVWPRPNNPAERNFFVAAGVLIMLSYSNAIVTAKFPERNISLNLRCALSLWSGLVGHIQEFHDMKGDRVAGKRTLPIVLGEERIWMIRYATCWIFFVMHSLFLLWGIRLAPRLPYPLSVYVVGTFQFLVGSFLGWRVLRSKSVKTDRANYHKGLIPLYSVMLVYMNLLATAH